MTRRVGPSDVEVGVVVRPCYRSDGAWRPVDFPPNSWVLVNRTETMMQFLKPNGNVVSLEIRVLQNYCIMFDVVEAEKQPS